MQILNSGRGSGKTYALVQWLLQDPEKRVIVVSTEEIARSLRSNYLLSVSQVISGNEETVRAKLAYRSLNTQIAFDGVEGIVRHALRLYAGPKEIAIFTSSFEEYNKDPAQTPLQQAETLEAHAALIRKMNHLPPLQTAPPEVTRLIELGDQLGSAVRDFLNKK